MHSCDLKIPLDRLAEPTARACLNDVRACIQRNRGNGGCAFHHTQDIAANGKVHLFE